MWIETKTTVQRLETVALNFFIVREKVHNVQTLPMSRTRGWNIMLLNPCVKNFYISVEHTGLFEANTCHQLRYIYTAYVNLFQLIKSIRVVIISIDCYFYGTDHVGSNKKIQIRLHQIPHHSSRASWKHHTNKAPRKHTLRRAVSWSHNA